MYTNPLRTLTTLLPLVSLSTCISPSPHLQNSKSNTTTFNWHTTKSTGVNLGGWLVQESTIDTEFWTSHSPNATDEWTLCANLGPQCGPVLENRYATFITESDIDTLAAAGVTILRIPTTYAAWINLTGSALYSGRQSVHLRRIAEYAIAAYNMHIILDIHSLPGGLNGLTIGEAEGHWGWFYNETAWNYSLDVMNAALDFITDSGSPQSYTLEPLNEPADRNKESELGMAVFGTPEALSVDAAGYVLGFWKAVINLVTERGLDVAVMAQSFKLPGYWDGEFEGDAKVVFDMHNYYFEGRETTAENLREFMLSDAEGKSGGGSFPVFIGEWSIQAAFNNSFALRERNLQYGFGIWEEYTQGSCYWTAKFEGNATVDGEGSQKDYWSFERFIEAGYL
ncbi:glycoside hydrolase superfamily [Aspergillus cavernicola]|uniref:glucan 1,3-beta-glucosidase n=1 Tax=Aspergillus cavernicola TaxID=176166 RepID=A0ABR4IWI8_9EURO